MAKSNFYERLQALVEEFREVPKEYLASGLLTMRIKLYEDDVEDLPEDGSDEAMAASRMFSDE